LALAEWLDPALLEPPPSMQRVLRALLPRIVNLGEVLTFIVERLQHQIAITEDEQLAGLLEELTRSPLPVPESSSTAEAASRGILLPMRLRDPDGGELSLFGTVATFGTALEVTTSELSIECLFPADEATAERLRTLPRT
jgi:hypothetical protein